MTWTDIVLQMRSLANEDPEESHRDADWLLLKALALAVDDPPERHVAAQIEEAWKAVRKWYA